MRKLKLLLAICTLFVLGGNYANAREDVTSTYITDAELSNETTNWALTSSGGNHAWDNTNKYHESWHNTFTITQTTAALPAGYYQLSIQAAVQNGNSTTISLQATSGSNSSVAVYPKYSTHSSYADMAAWWAADASHTGNRNLNRIFTTVYVEEGQTLTATFKQTANDQWFVYGQMQLHKLTDAEGRYAQKFEAVYNPMTNLDLASGRYKQRFESYTGGDVSRLTGKKLNKTISSLPNGKYNVTLNGGASYAQNSGVSGGGEGDNKTKFFANNASTNVTVVARTGIGNSEFTDYTASNALVSDGNLEVGFNNIAAGANWFVGSVKYIEYVDPYISELAIGSFTSGNTMEAGEWYSYTIPTDGDYTLSATEGIVYALDGNFASQASAVTSTLALPAGTVYFKSSTSQALTISYVEPVVENGTYYLYDETNKVFLSRGNDYGTRASVDKYGIPITWNNYSKVITFSDWENVYMFFDKSDHTACWLYTDGGSDKGNNRLFAFESTESGYYLRDLAKDVYIKHDNNVLTVPTTNSAEATIWTLKNREEHDAIVAAYVNDNKNAVITAAGISTTAAEFESYLSANLAAKDKTSLVGTAKFTGSKGDWEWTNVRSDGNVNYGTDWAEAWRKSGYWAHSTITDLPEGIYKLTVNAFERANGYVLCNTLGEAGWEPVTAYFEANGEKVVLKSWYSEKEGTNNPNNTTQAATAFNNDKYKNEVYCYVGDDGILNLKVSKPSFTWDSWVLFNNVTLTYYDSNVSDDDATAILAEASTTMDSPMKHSLYEALSTAKETFDGSRTVPNYNALRTAIDNTATSIASYANMYTNYLEPLTTYLATSNFIDESSDGYTEYAGYKASYDNYKTTGADVENATANSLSWNSGGRYVTAVTKVFAANWKIGETSALTDASCFYINNWSTENKGTGDAKDFANPFFEYWVSSGSLAATTLTGTLTGLTANTAYDVTAKVRVQGSSKVAGSITMEVVGGVPVDVTAGDAIMDDETPTGRYIKSYTATGVTDGDGNLVLKFNVAANSNISWLAFRDVNYATSEATISNDFTALNTAISTAEGHTLGFENGEYAPYNNVDGIEALAEAKAFDKTRYYIPAVITTATTALTGCVWTANADEVNAFYKGDFNGYAEDNTSPLDYTPNGWTASANMRMMLTNAETYPGLADASVTTAMMSWGGGITYGETIGYTMPLKANTIYRLQFKAAGWNNETRSGISVSILNSTDGMALYNLGTPDRDIKGNETNTAGMTSYDVVFATGAAGNYVFHIQSGNNIVVTDFSITKAASQVLDFADGSVPSYAPGTYPSVKITRSLTADRWATAVYPFAVSGVDYIAVLNSYDKATGELNFSTAAASVANEPFFMKSKTAKSEIELSDVVVAAASATDATASEASLKGTYATIDITNAEKNYVLSSNTIYPVGAAGATIDPYRAYIQVAQDALARLTFIVDGETTNIENLTPAISESEGTLYNLNGQRVEKAQKGLFIKNGKKVVVK